jgi:hypothetical protein
MTQTLPNTNDRVIISTGMWQQWIDRLPTPKYAKDQTELMDMAWHRHIFRITRIVAIANPEKDKEAIAGCQVRSEDGSVIKVLPINCLVIYPEGV